MQGSFDGKLTEQGLTQAARIAAILQEIPITTIYTSDLSRARITADMVAAPHKLRPTITRELRERSMGVWEGKKKEDLGLRGYIMGLPSTPEGGETLEQLYDRAEKFLEFLEHTEGSEKEQTVLIVSHNGMIKAIISGIEERGAAGITTTPDLENTELKYAEYKNGAWHMIREENGSKSKVRA